ncbi:MAG: Na+ dependent nucleoside transporter N-terminal domain-containing protein, partial [Bacteroidales bacterium]
MMAKNTLPGVTLFLVTLLFFSSCTSPEQATVGTEITQPWVVEYAVDQQSGEQIDAPEGEHLTFSGGDAPVFNAETSVMDLQATGRWVLQEDTLVLIPQSEDLQLDIDSVVFQSTAGQPQLLYYHQGEMVAQQDNETLTADEKPIVFMVEEISKSTLVLTRGQQTYHLTYEPTEAIVTSFSFRNLFRGLLGMFGLIAIAWLFSSKRKAINWKVVGIGLSIQLLLAFGILQVPAVQFFFEVVGSFFVVILDFTKEGTEFLFGGFLDVNTYGFIFAFQVLPTIIFFSALTSLLFYLGIIQKIVYGLAWVMTKAMQLSGAESLSVAGNIFLGQTESPLMIKAYLENMNRSEILLVMTGGMATMAGGVLAAYISFLGGDDPVQRLIFAKHLLAASIMAAPG